MTRFLLDAMCGSLATYLRMCGRDAAYALDRDAESDAAVVEWAQAEDRTVVTRDASLADRVADAILLTERGVEGQVAELAAAGCDLTLPDEPVRCGRCNGTLEQVSADASRPDHVPSADERPVWRCRDCGQHFWRGSHWADVRETLDRVT